MWPSRSLSPVRQEVGEMCTGWVSNQCVRAAAPCSSQNWPCPASLNEWLPCRGTSVALWGVHSWGFGESLAAPTPPHPTLPQGSVIFKASLTFTAVSSACTSAVVSLFSLSPSCFASFKDHDSFQCTGDMLPLLPRVVMGLYSVIVFNTVSFLSLHL